MLSKPNEIGAGRVGQPRFRGVLNQQEADRERQGRDDTNDDDHSVSKMIARLFWHRCLLLWMTRSQR